MAIPGASEAIITAKTGTETATFFLRKDEVPARLTAIGLAGAEVIPLTTREGADGTAEGVPYKDGAAISLKVADPVLTIWAPGPYKIVKPATAGNCAVYLSKGKG